MTSQQADQLLERYLVLGDPGWQYPIARQSDVLVLAEVGAQPGPVPVTVHLPRAVLEVPAVTVIDGSDVELRQLDDPAQFWHGITARAGLPGWPVGRPLAPLAVLLVERRRSDTEVHVHACTRDRFSGLLFTEVASFEAGSDASVADLTRQASGSFAVDANTVGVEWQSSTVLEDGIEIEQKITVPAEVSPWTIAVAVADAVADGALPGFIPDVGNELQRWYFEQVNYEIVGPEPERAHVSLIPNPDGSYGFKRKTYAQDGLRRREEFGDGIDIPDGDVGRYVRARYPEFEIRDLPAFVRTRFDINVEHAASGHFFGVEVDEVQLADGRLMRQTEIEYHRSRISRRMNPATIDGAMTELVEHVLRIMRGLGIEAERTFYSKKSFLLDSLAELV